MAQAPGVPMPPMMFPAAMVQPENRPRPSLLSDDEYYMEQLRKESLLRTVKEMKEKQIFLFEIFIDFIDIKKENELLISRGEAGPLPPLRVRVKFANIPCLDIFEEEMLLPGFNQQDPLSGKVISLTPDLPSNPSRPQHGQWRSSYGKSCLFFMMPMELIHCIQTSPITVNVYRTVTDNYEHPASSVGHTRIRLEESFVDCVLRTGDEKSELPITAYQSQPCVIHNLAAEETGRMDMFIRLSCFGNMISTQFQSLKEGKEYVFKHSPGKSQLEGTYGVSLPQDYQPPKLMGKTDLTTLQPLIACQEQLVGVCIDVEKDLREDFISKTVLWKERDARALSKVCKQSGVCKCACSLESRKAVNNISCCDACTCNKSEMSIITNPQQYKGSFNLNSSFSDESLKERDFPRYVAEEICREPSYHDCICNQTEGDEPMEPPSYETPKAPSYFETKAEKRNERRASINRGSKKDSKSSFKKMQLQGAGDSDTKGPVLNGESVDKALTEDKREIVAANVPEEPKTPKETRPAKNKKVFSTVDLKKQAKKKETNESVNWPSTKKVHTQFDYRSREYPGFNIGHMFCVDKERMVPENMGWLWNIEDKHLGIKLRKGWRPGVISKSVSNRIVSTKKPRTSVLHGISLQATPGAYKSNAQHYGSKKTDKKGSFSDLIDQPPTFRLQHTAGQYYLSMMPIKEEDEEQKPVEMRVLPDRDSSESERSSDTSIEVFFTCPGALRRKVEKPMYAEVDTQYAEDDLKVVEVNRPATEKSKKKKGKRDGLVAPKTVESKAKDNIWEEQQTQMSLQKNKNK